MARLLQFLCVVIILCPLVFSQSKVIKNDSVFSRYYQEMKACGQPAEGSAAEKAIQDILLLHAKQLGFRTESYPVLSAHLFHSFSRSLRIIIPGASSQQVSLIVPLDLPEGKRAQSRDAWLNPALVKMVLDRFATNPPKATVVVEMLGAEDGEQLDGLGSRCLLELPGLKKRLFHVYFNWKNAREVWKIPHGMTGKLSPAWLLNRALDSLEQAGVNLDIRTISSQLHRLGLGLPNQIGLYLAKGLPIVELQPVPDSALHDPVVGDLQILEGLISLLGDTEPSEVQAEAVSHDGNYLVFGFFNRHAILGEYGIVIGFISGLFLLLVMVYFRRSRRQNYLRALARNWVSFLVITLLCIAGNLLAGFLIQMLFPLWSSESSYLAIMPQLLLVRILFALGFILMASFWLRMWLSAHSSFFGAAAFLSSVSMVVLILTYNVTLSVYALVAAVLVSMANQLRWRWLKAGCAALSGVALIMPLFEAIIQAPTQAVDEMLLKDPVISTLVLSFSLLPFCFLAGRMWLFLPTHRIPVRNLRRFAGIGLILGASIWTIALFAFGTSGILPDTSIELSHLNEETQAVSVMRFSASNSLPNGALDLDGHTFAFKGRSIDVPFDPSMLPALQTNMVSLDFLDRKTVRVSINSSSPIDSCAVSFNSPEAMAIHAINFPYRFVDAQSIEIFIGRHPALPLMVELTMPRTVRGKLEVSIRCLDSILFRPTRGVSQELPIQSISSAVLVVP